MHFAAIFGAVVTGLMYWLIWGKGLEYLEYRWRAAATNRRDEKNRAEAQARQRMAPLHSIQDSRDAATALMIGVAQERGVITPEQIMAIKREMGDVLGLFEDRPARFSFA